MLGGLVWVISKSKKLEENFQIVNGGEIYGIESSTKTSPYFKIRYVYEGKMYNSTTRSGQFATIPKDYWRYKFPVALEKDDPGFCKMLFSPSDFQYFKTDFPDSMRWILSYLRND